MLTLSGALFFLFHTLPEATAAEQRVVPAWVLDGMEQRARTAPTADRLLDLAELWARIAEDEEQRAVAALVAATEACINAQRSGCEALEVENAAALQAWDHAETRYRQFLRDYPDDPRIEQAIYGLGWAWQQQGAAAQAAAAFTWVGAADTDRSRAQGAWLLAGEYAFETWAQDLAIIAFDQAADEGGMLAPWARRRLAWAHYRAGNLDQAIEILKGSLTLPPHPQGSMNEESLNDLVFFFREAGMQDEWRAHSAFSPRLLLVQLAQEAQAQDRHETAVYLLRRIIAEDPTHAEVPALYAQIIEAYLACSQPLAALSEVERALQAHPERPEALSHALEHGLREGGLALQEAGKTAEALAVYDRYLLAGYTAYAHEVAYWRATALEALGRRAEAGAAYREVALRDPLARYARLAAEGARRTGQPLD